MCLTSQIFMFDAVYPACSQMFLPFATGSQLVYIQ